MLTWIKFPSLTRPTEREERQNCRLYSASELIPAFRSPGTHDPRGLIGAYIIPTYTVPEEPHDSIEEPSKLPVRSHFGRIST